MGGEAVYLGDLYTKHGLVEIISKLKNVVSYISLMIGFWEDQSCPDCGAPMKLVGGYINKCSACPDEHLLCDDEFYLKKIKERLEEDKLYRRRKK